MAMGDDDPLKPDYSCFMRSTKKTSFSNVVALNHGHLENYSHWREVVKMKAVTKIQNIFRGKLARKVAETNAKNYAFKCAKATALEDTRQRIAAEIWRVRFTMLPQIVIDMMRIFTVYWSTDYCSQLSRLSRLSVCFRHPRLCLSYAARNAARGIIRRGTVEMGREGTHEASQTSSGR